MAVAREFEEIVEGAGWYNYFEQVNVMGEEQTPQDVLPEMMAV